MKAVLTIASLTFKEAFRKKILVAAIALTVLFLAVYGFGLHYIAQEFAAREAEFKASGGNFSTGQAQVAHEMSKKGFLLLGIYFSSSIVSLLAIFSSVGSVSSEIENGMLHAILAKPIRRRDVILGKFIGYAVMLTIYSASLFVTILLLNHYIFGAQLTGMLWAIILFILQPLILLSVTMAGSTRFSTLANGIAAFMVYMIGLIGGMVEQLGAMPMIASKTLVNTGIVTSLIMPIDSIYRMIVTSIAGSSKNPFEAMFIGPFGAISEPSNAMAIYALVYLLFFLSIAIRTFSKRDIG